MITLSVYFYICTENISIDRTNEDSCLKLNLMVYRFLRKKFMLLVIAVLSIPCHAQQNSKIDSLIKVLKTQKEDISKVNTFNDLSRQLWLTGSYAGEVGV